MRISDWSSDVCSSDLHWGLIPPGKGKFRGEQMELVLQIGGPCDRIHFKGIVINVELHAYPAASGEPVKLILPQLANAARHKGIIAGPRSEEHTSELQSLMRISYAGFCLKKQITEQL